MKNIRTTGGVLTAGLVIVATLIAGICDTHSAAYAASNCDALNIIDCGLSGNSVDSYLSSLRSYYQKNDDGHGHTDLRAVYQWLGLDSAALAGMNSSNTFLGTVYNNGDVEVNGKIIATNAQITARFTRGTGFTHIEGDVYSRAATTYEYYNTREALVYTHNGSFMFAVEVDCANAVKGTPVPAPTPTPSPVLTPSPVAPTSTSEVSPAALPNTGAGNVVGIFAGVSILGAAAHYFVGKRRLGRLL